MFLEITHLSQRIVVTVLHIRRRFLDKEFHLQKSDVVSGLSRTSQKSLVVYFRI